MLIFSVIISYNLCSLLFLNYKAKSSLETIILFTFLGVFPIIMPHYSCITDLILLFPFWEDDIFLLSNSADRSRCLVIAGSCRRIRMPYFSLHTMLQKMLRQAPINKMIKSRHVCQPFVHTPKSGWQFLQPFINLFP